jgi:hypothetical protein
MMKRFAVAALVAFAMISAKPAAAATILFDPDGGGASAAFGANVFDWLPGNSLIEEHVDALGNPTGTGTIYFQANLGTVVAQDPANTFTNGSKGPGSWFTAVAKFDVVITPTGPTSSINTIVPGSGLLKIYADNERGNDLSGLGFALDGGAVEVLSAVVAGGQGVFSFTGGNAGPLDQYTPSVGGAVPEAGGDNYPGVTTLAGQGSTVLGALVTSFDAAYFKDLVVGTAFVLTNSSQIDPYNQANPSAQFSSNTIQDGGKAGVSSVGPVNGLGLNIIAQADANSAFTEVPEPASLTLLGLGLAGAAARRRQKKAQQQA